jgi:hypothetical protein
MHRIWCYYCVKDGFRIEQIADCLYDGSCEASRSMKSIAMV